MGIRAADGHIGRDTGQRGHWRHRYRKMEMVVAADTMFKSIMKEEGVKIRIKRKRHY